MGSIVKGVIGAQDFHQPDGTTTRTFTRATSTGPIMTLNDPFSEVDALVAFGGGSRFTDITLLAALTAIGTTNPMTLRLRLGPWIISSNRDWSAYTNVILKFDPGAEIEVRGVVAQIGCEIEAGRRQIIDLTDAAGADEERTMFSIKSDGPVNLIMASANVVANANTDTALCIGTSIANPCIIKPPWVGQGGSSPVMV